MGMDAKQCVKELWRGISCPSWGGLMGTLGVAAAWMGLCLWGITPSLIHDPRYTAYFEADQRDGFARLTAHTLRLAQQRPAEDSVVILSDSSGREAIEIKDLEKDLLAEMGRPIRVEMLAANGLSQWGQVAITDVIRDHVKGVVLLEISPQMLATGKEPATEYERWVAVESDAFREELRRAGAAPPPNWGNYFLDNYRFFVARTECVRYLLPGYAPPSEPNEHPTDTEHARPWAPWRYRKAHGMAYDWIESYAANRDMNLGIYQRMIQRLRPDPLQGQIKVAFYETIENPFLANLARSVDEERYRDLHYAPDMHAFEQANCVPCFSCGPEAGLTMGDFWDPFHMMSETGRARYTELLAQHVAVLLQSPVEDWPTVQAAMAPRGLGPATTQADQEETPAPAIHVGKRKKHP